MKLHLWSGDCPLTERITDVYLIIMLLVFPLFPGFSGYRAITASKFVFFLAATGLWLAALGWAWLRARQPIAFGPAQLAAAVYLLFCVLSWACSPHRAEAFLGAGRYDGLLTTLAYGAVFLGVSLSGRPKALHAVCLAAAVSLCALVALLQLAGLNPLGLYPNGYTYYDAGLRYSGAFLGTIGSTNILDAVLCLALPLCFGLYVCGGARGFLLPVALSLPVVSKAGGDGGILALLVTALIGMPLLLTEAERVRRALRGGAVTALILALTALWQPSAERGLVFRYAPMAIAAAVGAVVLAALSLLPLGQPSRRALRRFFCVVAVFLLLAGLVASLLAPADSGTLFELGQVLRGKADDSFGSFRIRIWKACLALVPERPLLGGGPGTAALRLNIEFSRYVPETGQTLRSFVDNTHNYYLGALVNTGVPGLAALLALGVLALRAGWKHRREPLYAALLPGALCCAIQEFFGLGLVLSMPLLWLALGLLCASPAVEVTYGNET